MITRLVTAVERVLARYNENAVFNNAWEVRELRKALEQAKGAELSWFCRGDGYYEAQFGEQLLRVDSWEQDHRWSVGPVNPWLARRERGQACSLKAAMLAAEKAARGTE